MKSQSNINQQPFTISELSNGMDEIIFCENITETQGKEEIFEFDMHEITIPHRNGLTEDIKDNYQEWIDFAKGKIEKPLSDKEKISEMQNKIDMQDAAMNELMFEIIPSMVGGE